MAFPTFVDSTEEVEVPLVTELGPARLSISKLGGRYRVSRLAPPIHTLVLSGGGAKGVAYAGAIQALTQLQVLPGIREVRGASAGAVVGALVACGMSADELASMTESLSLSALTANKGDAMLVPTTSGAMLGWWPRLFGTGRPLRELVRKHGRAALQARLADWLAQANRLDMGYRVVRRLQRELVEWNQPLTFRLLAEASRWVPTVKAFACSVSFQDCRGNPPAMMMLSAETTPDLDISRAVQASGALPLLFRRVRLKVPLGQGKARGRFFDGGCMLNTPARALLLPDILLTGLPDADELVLVFEPTSARAGPLRWLRWLADWIGGGSIAAASAWLRDQLARPVIARNIVQIPLRLPQGDYTSATTRLDLRREEKIWLRDSARRAIASHLRRRRSARISKEYDSLALALLALDEVSFSRVARHGLGRAAASTLAAVKVFRREVDAALRMLRIQAPAADMSVTWREWEQTVQVQLTRLCALLTGDHPCCDHFVSARLDYVLDRLHRLDYCAARRVLDLAFMRGSASRSRLEAAWLAHQEVIVVHTLVHEIQRQLLYPAHFARWQRGSNRMLLQHVSRRLPGLDSLASLQDELDGLLRHYRPWLGGHFGLDTLRRQVRAWLKEVRRLRQGRGRVWGGVTAFAQQRDGIYDM